MKRFAFTTLALLLAGGLLVGCGKKKNLVDVAEVRLEQDDPEAALKLARKGMTQEAAMDAYVQTVERLLKEHGQA